MRLRVSIKKRIKFYVIDAIQLAELKLGARINTIMQTCFFQIAGVLPSDKAIAAMKNAIQRYGRKGEEVVAMNFKAVDSAISPA